MAWWTWLLAGWVVLAVVVALLLAHRIGSADRRERPERARWATGHRSGHDRFAA